MKPAMNRQEVFDTVLVHLVQQGKRAVDNEGDCMYRAADGSKCALGVLMTDEDYEPILEYVSPANKRITDALPFAVDRSTFDGTRTAADLDDVSFLFDLQQLHDRSGKGMELGSFFKTFDVRVEKFANRYGLDNTNPRLANV